jgi:O-antigen ligase
MTTRLEQANPLPLLLALALVPATALLLATPRWPYAALPCVAVAGLFVLGRWPQWGYYAILLFVPLALFRTLSQSLTLSKLLGLATLALFALYLLLRRKGSYDLSARLWKWLLLFFLVNLVSTLLSSYPGPAWGGMRQLFNACVFFLLTLAFVDREGFVRTVPWVVMTGNLVSAGLSVFDYFTGSSWFSVDEGYGTEFVRAVGADNGPNDFAFMVLFSLPFFAGLLFAASTTARRAFGALGLAVGTVAIVLSYSRAGARVLVLVVVLVALEHLHRFHVRHLGLVAATAGAGLLGVVLLTPQSWWERQLSVSSSTDASVSRRGAYLPVAFDAFLDHPVLGTGTQTFKEIWAETSISRKYAPSPDGSYRRVAHNSYAEVLTGTGATGFVLYVGIIVAAFRSFSVSSRRFLASGRPEEAAMARTYRTSFLVVLTFFLTLTLNNHKYFWLCLALSQVAGRLSAKDDPAADGSGTVAPA